MADTNVPPLIPPDHIEETIRSIAQLRAEHHENATSFQRTVDHVTALLSRPLFIGVITVILMGWISMNLLAAALGVRPRSASFLMAGRCGFACVALHGRLDTCRPAA